MSALPQAQTPAARPRTTEPGARRPVVSVVINNYNYGRFVGRAVASALAQDASDFEVIVVDDGSSDDSLAVLHAYRDRATILAQDNRGQAAAINAGVRASRGEFVCFLDADDWWSPGKLSAVVEAFRREPGVSLTYHRLQPTLVDETPTSKPIPRTLCSGDLAPALMRSAGWWPFPMTSAIAVRRSAWDAVGDIPEQFRISADAWLAGIYPLVGHVAALPDTQGFYRIHSNNWYRATDDAAMLRKRMTHWQAVVDATNRFLAARDLPGRLRLNDHFPYQAAAARLDGTDWRRGLGLAFEGLRFAGEPNPLRRARDAVRTARDLVRGDRPPAFQDTAR
ncbi:glycosyltransferase family 2 protein [Aureimonas leprariae]|uniref:Glycosyltransferase n=1 Tax=Plantimonas leprariae TaxID=2615207 RepID=A0A7V7PQF1_9HYPH|nr:glycosyltransferase [Aureimonas leprariae]KAB0680357.1 glycosyltransferase [Aureimonas leprariae]